MSPGNSPSRDAPAADAATADKLAAEGKFADAARMYSDIIRKSRGRAPLEIYLKLGDVANQIAGEGMMNAVAARNAWETAAREYPASPEPHRRLMKFCLDYADISQLDTRLELIRKAGESARRLVEADPADFRSDMVLQQSIIEPFLFDRSGDTDAVEAAVARLREIEPKLPGEIDVPFFIGRAQAKMGSNYLKFGRREEGAELVKAGLATVDRMIAQYPASAGPLFRKAQILQAVGPIAYVLDKFDDETAVAEAQQQLSRDTADLLGAAVGYLKDDDGDLESIVSFAVQVQRAAGNDLVAENLLRAIMQMRPNSAAARIQLAELVSDDKARLEEILPIIEPACAPPQSMEGIAGLVAADTYRQALMISVRTRISLFEMLEARAADGDAALAQAQLRATRDELQIVVSRSPRNAPRVLRLLAQLALADKDPKRAVDLLNQAVPTARDLDPILHAELLTLLGKAYRRAGQPEEARKVFDDAIARTGFAPARVALVRQLVDEENYPEARPRLERLRNDLPADPEVQTLQAEILTWEARGNSQVLAGLLDKIPEDHTQAKVNKIGVASRVGVTATATRLIDELARQFPTDPRVVILRAQVLARAGDTEAALAALRGFDTQGVPIPQMQAMITQLTQK